MNAQWLRSTYRDGLVLTEAAMKVIFLNRVVARGAAALVLAVLALAPAKADDMTLSVVVAGQQRTAFVHLPQGFDRTKTYPLVIGFHGGLGNAENYIQASDLFEKSARAGFVAICPEGTAIVGPHRIWNSGPEYARASGNADDVAFTRALIGQAEAQYRVDPKRIYATGFSNGGQMSYRLALELSDKIAAIAPMSGARASDGLKPLRSVPVMHFHGTADSVYPVDGGLGRRSIGRTPHVSIANVIGEWVMINGAALSPRVTSHDGWQEHVYSGGAPVELVLVDGMGHQIAGGNDDHLPDQPMRATPDAVAMALVFFTSHPMP